MLLPQYFPLRWWHLMGPDLPRQQDKRKCDYHFLNKSRDRRSRSRVMLLLSGVLLLLLIVSVRVVEMWGDDDGRKVLSIDIISPSKNR
jgi:predicted nucleic acid-binding Zn ribbon protein